MKRLILVLILCLTACGETELSSLDNASFSQCGINSLYLCLKYHHINENLDDVYVAIKPDKDNNVSLQQLADFAKTKGLYVHPIIKPSFIDIKKYLNKDSSIVLQYVIDLPDKTKFRHIIALVKADEKIFLLDYPGPAKEKEAEELAVTISNSEGMLVLSKQPISNFAELFNGRNLKSLSFYAICTGLALIIFIVYPRKQAG